MTGFEIPATAFSHRWKIATTTADELNELMQRHVIKLNLDLANKTFYLEIQQPQYESGLFSAIEDMARINPSFTVYQLNGREDAGVYFTIGAELSKHEYALSYEASDIAVHRLWFKNVNLVEDKAMREETDDTIKTK